MSTGDLNQPEWSPCIGGERTDESRGSVAGIFFYFNIIISPKLWANVSSLFKILTRNEMSTKM